MAAALAGSGSAAASEEGPSGDDDYVPTVLQRRAAGRRGGRLSRQASLAAPHPTRPLLALALDAAAPPPPPTQPVLSAAEPEAAAAAAAAAMFSNLPALASMDNRAKVLTIGALAATLSSDQAFHPLPVPLLFNPLAAAAAAATYAAAATMAEHAAPQPAAVPTSTVMPVLEESMAGAALPSPPAAAAPCEGNARVPAATPAAARRMPSALTSHLSDMAGEQDPDIRGALEFAKLGKPWLIACCRLPSFHTAHLLDHLTLCHQIPPTCRHCLLASAAPCCGQAGFAPGAGLGWPGHIDGGRQGARRCWPAATCPSGKAQQRPGWPCLCCNQLVGRGGQPGHGRCLATQQAAPARRQWRRAGRRGR